MDMLQLPRTFIFLSLLITGLLLSSCKSGPPTVERALSANISQSYASFRANQVSNVHYDLHIDITGRKKFSGTAKISFDLVDNNRSPITLDFERGDIDSIKINGSSKNIDYERWFIEIPAKYFKPGSNQVEISYSRPYASDGQGLHQYHDTETDNHYLYTQFEAYAANRFAPMFDQPDIKASFTMDVSAPSNWHVISALKEKSISPGNKKQKTWHFPTTKKIPTYIFSLHAGPFAVWEDNYEGIPLRLFARQEMAEFIDPQEWFYATKGSFNYLQKFFDYPYPFEKYDQLAVPDFNFGAMENVGAVTFSERFVYRGEKTIQQKYRLANVIAHEMAHMWFGNIVTMKWWNGLWLNESFATYLAYATIASIPGYENAWTYFSDLKGWAYYEDQLVTTHPIEVPVESSGDAFNVLDGISYAKGAAVLKQLSHYVGQDNFQKSLSHYIHKHAFENTNLADFAAAIEHVSGKDMNKWVLQWLLSPGLNSIQMEQMCKNGNLVELTLWQSATEQWPTLREQRVQLGLYTLSNGEMKSSHIFPVTYTQQQNTINLPATAIPCPEFVYPNEDGWGYLKIRFSETDRAVLKKTIHQFKSPTMRLDLWRSMWSLVHDAEMPISQYLDFVDQNIPNEFDDAILHHILFHVKLSFNLIESMNLADASLAQQQKIEKIMWREFAASTPGSSRQKAFFEAATSVTFSASELDRLVIYLDENKAAPDFTLNPDYRWNILTQLSRYQHPQATKLLQIEKEKDTSERARLAILASDAVRPDKHIKSTWLNEITNPESDLKLADMRVVLNNLFLGKQQKWRFEFADQIKAGLTDLAEQKDEMFFRYYAEQLLPAACTNASTSYLAEMLKNNSYNSVITKKLKIAHQNDQRCIDQKNLFKLAAGD